MTVKGEKRLPKLNDSMSGFEAPPALARLSPPETRRPWRAVSSAYRAFSAACSTACVPSSRRAHRQTAALVTRTPTPTPRPTRVSTITPAPRFLRPRRVTQRQTRTQVTSAVAPRRIQGVYEALVDVGLKLVPSQPRSWKKEEVLPPPALPGVTGGSDRSHESESEIK